MLYGLIAPATRCHIDTKMASYSQPPLLTIGKSVFGHTNPPFDLSFF